MPVTGADGKAYPWCGICGNEPERERGCQWSLNKHCEIHHGLTIFPACVICQDRVHARSRLNDVTQHIGSRHLGEKHGNIIVTDKTRIQFVVWVLVDIRDEDRLNFHPRSSDLALLPARGEELTSSVQTLVKNGRRWLERCGAGTHSRGPSTSTRRGSSPPSLGDALKSALAKVQEPHDDQDDPSTSVTKKKARGKKKATASATVSVPPPDRAAIQLTELDMQVDYVNPDTQARLDASGSRAEGRPLRGVSKRTRRQESSPSSSSSPSSGESAVEPTGLTFQPLSATKARVSRKPAARTNPLISPVRAPQLQDVASPSPSRRSPRKRTTRQRDEPPAESPAEEERSVTPPRGLAGASVSREPPAVGLRFEEVPPQPWETAFISPQQTALQDTLRQLSGASQQEVERFQRLLTHLGTTYPGGARELLRAHGLLPQTQPGTISLRADGTHIYLPDDVLDFRQLAEVILARGQRTAEEEAEESRGSKGPGAGKKSRK